MRTTVNAFSVNMTGPDIQPLIDWMEGLTGDNPVLVEATRQALVLGVLRNVRRRFLEQMGEAQKVYLANASQRKQDMKQVLAERRALAKARRLLRRAYDKLDKATLANDKDAIRSAKRNLGAKEARLVFATMGIDAGRTKKRSVMNPETGQLEKRASKMSVARANRIMKDELASGDLKLGSLMEGLMKKRQLEVLSALTAASNVTVSSQGGQIVASAGSETALEAIETPSLAEKGGRRSPKSPHRQLWRQLEFGAGANRVASELNPIKKTDYSLPGGLWFFGPLPRTLYMHSTLRDTDAQGTSASAAALARYGLVVRGIKPMHFLFAYGKSPYLEDAEAALRYFNEALLRSAPQF